MILLLVMIKGLSPLSVLSGLSCLSETCVSAWLNPGGSLRWDALYDTVRDYLVQAHIL